MPYRPWQENTSERWGRATNEAEATSSDAEQFYMGRAKAFDPQAALNQYAHGAYGSLQSRMSDELRALAGSAVGAGRLDTGFYDMDRGDLWRRNMDSFNNALAGQSMNAAGLDLQNFQGVGSFGANRRSSYYDMLSGTLDRETAERNAKRQSDAALWSGLLGLAGSALGGPLGGMIGSAVGLKKP